MRALYVKKIKSNRRHKSLGKNKQLEADIKSSDLHHKCSQAATRPGPHRLQFTITGSF